MAEHHFQPEGYECIPNLLMWRLHLAASHAEHPARLRLQHRADVAPTAHRRGLRDGGHLSGGRMVFGVGRGYHTREVETFGAPLLDQEANRSLFEEQVEVILKAFHEESFSHQGKQLHDPPPVPYRGYELEQITLVPRPLRQPVEVWQPIQGASERALDFMAKHRIKGTIGGGVAEGGAMDSVVHAYRDALRRTGRESKRAKTSTSASTSRSPTRRSRRCGRQRRTSKRT